MSYGEGYELRVGSRLGLGLASGLRLGLGRGLRVGLGTNAQFVGLLRGGTNGRVDQCHATTV